MNFTRTVIEIIKPGAEKFPLLASTYRHLRNSSQRIDPQPIEKGFKFTGNKVMESGIFELEECEIIEEYLKDADVFINVGANVGYYCCIALQKGKKTIAFEPMDTNLRFLYANVKANGWENNIEIFPVAIGNKVGLIEIYGGGTGASLIKGWAENNYGSQLVPVAMLDNILLNRFEHKKVLFLVDIEGAEKFMLDGAVNQLKMAPKPIWIVEISIDEHQPSGTVINPFLFETFKRFWDNGYEARTADKALRLVAKEDILHINFTDENILPTRKFIFREVNSTN